MREYVHEFAEHLYHTPTSLEKHAGIVPIRMGYNRAKDNYRIGPRYIVYFSMHFVLKGSVILSWEDAAVELHAGDLFVLFPHQIHEYNVRANHDEPLEMLWIAAAGKQMPLIVRRLGLTSKTPFLKDFFDPIFKDQLFQFAEKWRTCSKSDDLSLFYYLIGLLNQLVLMQNQPVQSPSSEDWIKTSLDYIHLNYMEGITVQNIADHIGIHRSHFSNIFAQKIGKRPQRYLMEMIMNKAMEMLNETTMPITHIALSLGYSDVYSFTHSFKSYYGKPPSHCRDAKSNLG